MVKKVVIGIIVLTVVVGIFVYLYQLSKKPGKLDGFAQCLKDSGAIFYGAWWCPHCQNQKAMFGRSAELLPYVECQTTDRKSLPVCTEAGIQSYPFWKFADGTDGPGVLSIEELSARTACSLPTS